MVGLLRLLNCPGCFFIPEPSSGAGRGRPGGGGWGGGRRLHNHNAMEKIIHTLELIGPSIAGILAFIQGIKNQHKINELHIIINSRLTELLNQTSLAQHAIGKAEGIAEGKLRTE